MYTNYVTMYRREKKEEKTPVSSSKALFRFSSPIGSFYRIGI